MPRLASPDTSIETEASLPYARMPVKTLTACAAMGSLTIARRKISDASAEMTSGDPMPSAPSASLGASKKKISLRASSRCATARCSMGLTSSCSSEKRSSRRTIAHRSMYVMVRSSSDEASSTLT